MKQQKSIRSINIDTPCKKESWSEMSKAGKDRLCNSCETIVVDFENYSDEEIIQYFEKRKFQKTCGRFTKKQIENLNTSLLVTPSTSRIQHWIKAFIIATTISVVACNPSKKIIPSHDESFLTEKAPEKIIILGDAFHPDSSNIIVIKGQILEDNRVPLPAANVVYGTTEIGVTADIDGFFKLEIPTEKVSGEDIVIKYIGYKDIIVKLDDVKNKEVEIMVGSEEDTHIIIGMINNIDFGEY